MAVPIFWLTWAAFSVASLIASMSVPSRAFLRSATASLTSDLMSSGIFSAFSATNFSVWYASVSARLRVSASSRRPASPPALSSAAPLLRWVASLARGGPAGDRHPLLLARAKVLGRDVDDAVGVDVERDLDLRHTAWRRRDAGQLEHAELLVVLG